MRLVNTPLHAWLPLLYDFILCVQVLLFLVDSETVCFKQFNVMFAIFFILEVAGVNP